MSEIEAGSITIRVKRGDILEAMIAEGLEPEIAERVFDRMTKRQFELESLRAAFEVHQRKTEADFIREKTR